MHGIKDSYVYPSIETIAKDLFGRKMGWNNYISKEIEF